MKSSSAHQSGKGIWLLLAGFATAALLTLAAAIGTSVWQQDANASKLGVIGPVAQK